MKLKLLYLQLFIFASLFSSPSFAKAKEEKVVKAQHLVTTEFGHLSIGVVAQDWGMCDPHAWVENETLYVMCGHDQSWGAVTTWNIDRWELWSTKDMLTWKLEYTINPTDTYIGDKPNCWAGDICKRNGKYYWFFSNRNIDSGVMVADKITGPYKDLLGKPLIPKGIVPHHSYDPEIFEENGVHHVCFGAGRYYMSPLSDDMKSLAAKPQQLKVLSYNGGERGTSDKPSLFKRGDWYYLAYGFTYAMSKNLYGPYQYKGNFGDGESNHNSFFEWKGQWYMIHEMTETTPFFRGVGVQPIYFKEDGTLFLAEKRAYYPGYGKDYSFKFSQMGWHSVDGTTLEWNKRGYIEGEISDKNSTVASGVFLWCDLRKSKEVAVTVTNNTSAKSMKVGLATRPDVRGPWGKFSPDIKDSDCIFVEKNIKKGKQSFVIPLSEFKGIEPRLMQVRIEPASGAESGKWKLDNIVLR